MQLACNYYAETEALVRAGRIDIDYFKFPALPFQMAHWNWRGAENFMAALRQVRPVLYHGLHPLPHELASPTFVRDFDAKAVRRLLAITQTPGISLHPTLRLVDPAISARQLVETIAANLRFVRETVPGLAFVSVENSPSLKFGPLIQPEVITEIVRQSGCAFLLDISHAYCASRALGVGFREYLKQLPLKDVYEIHINGWAEKDGATMCHVKINDTGYAVLAELLEVCEPEIVTIEYGRHNDRIGCGCPVMTPEGGNAQAADEIIEQVGKIREILPR